MIKEYHISGFYLLIALFLLLLVTSCTYDYFEDETNYVVYIPKADKNVRTEDYKVEDVNILIYNGDLQKERYSYHPFAENARSIYGNFNFRLYPGTYSVYNFTELQETSLIDLSSHSQARFELKQSADGLYYEEPQAIYVEYKNPTIHFPGPLVIDTVLFETKYTGRICIAFKNLTKIDPSLTYNNIKKIKIEARGIGVTQYLSKMDVITDNTRSSRKTPDDKMLLTSTPFKLEYKDFEFGVQNNYYPSPDLSQEGREFEPIDLNLSFIGQDDTSLSYLNIAVKDKNRNPVVLHMDETLVVEVDGNNITILRLDNLEEWNPQIESEDDSDPSGGGISI
ncbi:MAG: hypothetical protein LBV43_09990 [Prevotella sp.]|jgi:hypothetical protein|nr:hypothetical protein [Prevotella sp.]